MRRLDIFQEKTDTTLIVGPNNSLNQSFIPTKDDLAGIRFPVFNPRLGGQASYQISIVDERNQIIYKEVIKESNLGWGDSFRFDFSPIHDSQNKKFSFIIVSLDGKNEDGKIITKINAQRIGISNLETIDTKEIERVQSNYLSLSYSNTDNYRNGYVVLNGQKLKGDLVFEVYYQTNLSGFIEDSLVDFKNRVRIDSGFLMLYLILLSVLIVFLISRLKLLRIIKKK